MVKKLLEKDSDGTYATLKNLISFNKETAGIFLFAILSLGAKDFKAIVSKLPEIFARFRFELAENSICKHLQLYLLTSRLFFVV